MRSRGDRRGSRGPELDPGHLLRDHLLDLWLHISVHCFSCPGGNGNEKQSLWELPRGWSPPAQLASHPNRCGASARIGLPRFPMNTRCQTQPEGHPDPWLQSHPFSWLFCWLLLSLPALPLTRKQNPQQGANPANGLGTDQGGKTRPFCLLHSTWGQVRGREWWE